MTVRGVNAIERSLQRGTSRERIANTIFSLRVARRALLFVFRYSRSCRSSQSASSVFA